MPLLRLFFVLACLCLSGLPALANAPMPATPLAPTAPLQAEKMAVLSVLNRPIVTFRASYLGAEPSFRASRARMVIDDALREGSDLVVSTRATPEGQLVMLGSRLAFTVTTADADPLAGETASSAAEVAARQLSQVIAESMEARNVERMSEAAGAAAIASATLLALLWLLHRFSTRASTWLIGLATRKAAAIQVGGNSLITAPMLILGLRRVGLVVKAGLVLLLVYEWLSFVLLRFPYTRSWGERLNGYLLGVVGDLLGGMLSAVPGLLIALVIFMLARMVVALSGRLLKIMAFSSGTTLGWLRPDTVTTTRRLLSIVIWLFALAMAYPYLPGAQTEAFKGLSVLLGLMISLGASSIVGQGTAGLVLTYTGAIRVGEYVQIGEHEGTVVEMGVFTTRIRTGLGEELTLPNALITTTVTKNYSRTVKGSGYVVDTTVTIGYDTPWRQVEAMLIEAARRTPGILTAPAPRVFQTALSDYYPEYRLVAQAIPSEPRPRAEVMSALHANIQDVFNTYGVQIMSPHYMSDPAAPKVVPPAGWQPAPAPRDGQSG